MQLRKQLPQRGTGHGNLERSHFIAPHWMSQRSNDVYDDQREKEDVKRHRVEASSWLMKRLMQADGAWAT